MKKGSVLVGHGGVSGSLLMGWCPQEACARRQTLRSLDVEARASISEKNGLASA